MEEIENDIKKEKGAALVLALLLLMFFVALTFNMFYIAQHKNERAGVIYLGQRTLSNIDTGQNIALFELKLARDYCNDGAAEPKTPYDIDTNGYYKINTTGYNAPSTSQSAINHLTSQAIITTITALNLVNQKHFVKTKDVYDFFSRAEMTTPGTIAVGSVVSRTSTNAVTLAFSSSGAIVQMSRTAKIWGVLNNQRSVGEYKLTEVSANGFSLSYYAFKPAAGSNEDWNEEFAGTLSSSTVLKYEKGIEIRPSHPSFDTAIGRKYYNITYEETVSTTTGSAVGYLGINTVNPQNIKAISIDF